MNLHRVAQLAAWGLAGLMAAASAAAWATAVPGLAHSDSLKGSGRALPVTPAPVDTAQLAAGAAGLRDHNPFRWERQPSNVRFNPWELVTPPAPLVTATPGKPVLALAGIVGGPPWTALIEGIPERQGGVLLRVGETIGKVRLEEVRGDTARVSGFDTTWVLTPRRAWP